MEAASQAQSASQTPVLDPFIGDFDEEDRKPNVAYLDALNANRKRSRSLEDESEKGSKLLRSNAGTPVFSQSSQISSAVTSPSPFTDTSFTDMESSTELMTSQKSLIGGDNEPMISGIYYYLIVNQFGERHVINDNLFSSSGRDADAIFSGYTGDSR